MLDSDEEKKKKHNKEKQFVEEIEMIDLNNGIIVYSINFIIIKLNKRINSQLFHNRIEATK